MGTPASSNSSCVIVVVHLGGARAPQPVGDALRDGNFKKVVQNTRFKRVFSAIIGKDRTVRERVPTRVIVRGDQRGNNAKGGHDVSAWQPSSVGFLIVNYCRPSVVCSRLYGDITIVKCHGRGEGRTISRTLRTVTRPFYRRAGCKTRDLHGYFVFV